jgi:hypothetical protein
MLIPKLPSASSRHSVHGGMGSSWPGAVCNSQVTHKSPQALVVGGVESASQGNSEDQGVMGKAATESAHSPVPVRMWVRRPQQLHS